MNPSLKRRPEARGFRVEKLLEEAQAGRLRIPEFQRPLRWKSKDVVELFDSINRGFPIGDLLLSRAKADGEIVSFGSVSFEVADQHSALWVVDGQQRLTALIAALLRPEATPRRDYWAVWYDLESQAFKSLNRRESNPLWIPVNALSDSVKQLKWIRAWPYAEDREDLVDLILELGKSIREYEVPAYIVEDADDEVLRLIFTRINTGGAAMLESEIFEALYGHEGEKPIRAAVARLADLGFGTIDGDLFLRCLKSVCTDMRPDDKIPDDLPQDSIHRTEKALRRAIKVLIQTGIPRFKLMPYRLPLYILSAFYDRFPEENQRVDVMAGKWVWRGAMSQDHTDSSDAKVAKLVRFIRSENNAEIAMVALSKMIDDVSEADCIKTLVDAIDDNIGLNSAMGKLFVLMLFAAGPRRCIQEEADLFAHVKDQSTEGPEATQLHTSKFYRSIHGNTEDRLGIDLIARLNGMPATGPIIASEYDLDSLLLTDDCLERLRSGGVSEFRSVRHPILEKHIEEFVVNRTQILRPSIPAIVQSAQSEEA